MKFERLGNIAEVIAGQSPPSDTYNKSKDGLPFFQGNADFGDMFPQVRYWCTAPQKIALPNDILMTVRAPVGPVNICNVESCIGRGLSAIRVKNNHFYKYIYYFLKSHEKQIARLGVGSTFKAITQKVIKNLQIPLPEKIEDQIRIANILSKAEALIKQRKDSIDLLNEFLKSTFLDMFGDPLKNDKRWQQDKVENYTDCIVPGRDKPKSFTGKTPWFTTDDLIDKGFVVTSKKELGLSEFEIDEVRAKKIPIGSVLMTCVGDLGIVSINKEICIVNQQLHAFQCKPMLNNVFLMFNLSFMKSFMYKMASTTTVPYMNKTICNSIPIFIPPISLQTQFALIVEKTEVLKEKFQESLHELENLYGSLSQQAFNGALDLSKMNIDKITSVEKKKQKIETKDILNLDTLKFIERTNEVYEQFAKQTDISTSIPEFTKHLDLIEKLQAPIKNLQIIPDAVIEAQTKFNKIKDALYAEAKIKKQLEILNPSIHKFIEKTNEAYNLSLKQSELVKNASKFTETIEQIEKLLIPLKSLPKIPDTVSEAYNRFEKIKNLLPVKIDAKEKVEIEWKDISTQQAANWIKDNYTGYHFNSEMLIRFFKEEQLTYPNYYSSEELKKYPQLNEADDLKSFIFSALNNENPFLKLEQIFYDGEKENFQLNITKRDYEIIRGHSPKERSGVYFKIIE